VTVANIAIPARPTIPSRRARPIMRRTSTKKTVLISRRIETRKTAPKTRKDAIARTVRIVRKVFRMTRRAPKTKKAVIVGAILTGRLVRAIRAPNTGRAATEMTVWTSKRAPKTRIVLPTRD